MAKYLCGSSRHFHPKEDKQPTPLPQSLLLRQAFFHCQPSPLRAPKLSLLGFYPPSIVPRGGLASDTARAAPSPPFLLNQTLLGTCENRAGAPKRPWEECQPEAKSTQAVLAAAAAGRGNRGGGIAGRVGQGTPRGQPMLRPGPHVGHAKAGQHHTPGSIHRNTSGLCLHLWLGPPTCDLESGQICWLSTIHTRQMGIRSSRMQGG